MLLNQQKAVRHITHLDGNFRRLELVQFQLKLHLCRIGLNKFVTEAFQVLCKDE